MIKNFTFSSSMRRFLKERTSKKGALTLLLLGFGFVGQAQIGVTVDNPSTTTPNLDASYSSLKLALDAVNGLTAMNGPIKLTLASGSTGIVTEPVVDPKGLTLGSASLNPLLSATNTITIVAATGATPTLQAGTGTTTTINATTPTPDGIFKLVGADYVTIDGLTLIDGNTANTNGATMEFGLGMFKAGVTDGCQNNTIKNCTITMPSINVSSSTLVPGGANGILVTNAIPTAANTALTPTAVTGTNSYNNFYKNTINGGTISISLIGYANTTAPYNYTDTSNDIGGTSAATGNNFLNFGGSSSGSACAVNTTNQHNLKVSYNTIDNTTSGTTQTTTCKGIVIGTCNGASTTITYNTITVKTHATGATNSLTAIENNSGFGNVGNTTTISNNTIQNCSFPTATNGSLIGISNLSQASNVNINNNSFINNTIGTIGTAGTANMWGINNSQTSQAAQVFTATANIISNNRILNQGGSFIGFRTAYHNINCSNNTISDNSISNSGAALAASIYGFSNISNSAAISQTYSNNTISNLTIVGNSTGACLIYGIVPMTTTTGTSCIISGNKISGLTSSTATSEIRGIFVIQKDANIYNNKIYDLTGTGTGTAAKVTGLYLGNSAGTINIYNNFIGNLYNPNQSANNLSGIYNANTLTGTANIYYNTIHLDAKGAGTDFGSRTIYTSATPTLSLRNNILINNSDSKGTFKSNIIERAAADFTKYDPASNNNLFFSNSGANIYADDTTTIAGLTEMKTYLTGRESASISENPSFTSNTGSDPAYLHINVGSPTAINGGATKIAGYSTDFDGDTRNDAGSDIGADEFTPALVSMTVTAPATVCGSGTANLTAAAVTAGSEAGLMYTYWTDAQATAAYATPAAATAGTYYIKGTNSTTGGFVIKSVTVVGSPNPSLIVTNPAAVCAPAKVDITAAAVTAGSDAGLTLSYWTDQAATNSYATPAAAANGTYYIKATNPTTTCSAIQPVTAKVNTVSTPTLGTVTQPTCTTATGSVVLSGLPSGNWTITRHLVGGTAADDFHYYGSETTYTASGLATGTYKFDLSDVTFCTSAATANVVINAQPVAPAVPTLGTVTQPTCTTTTGSVALSGLSSGNWTITRHLVGGTAADDVLYYGSGTSYTASGLATGTYTFDWSDSTYCTSVATANVVINAQPVTPSAPTGSAQQTFAQGKKVSDIVITKDPNGTVKWFDSEAKALAGTPALSNDDVLTTANYYGMQTVNGCTSSAPLVVAVTVTALGINDFDMAGLRYYPNPVKSELTVDYSNEISSIELFNLLGQQLRTVRPNSFSAKVDMSDLPMGTYLLQLCSEGKSRMIKVVKE